MQDQTRENNINARSSTKFDVRESEGLMPQTQIRDKLNNDGSENPESLMSVIVSRLNRLIHVFRFDAFDFISTEDSWLYLQDGTEIILGDVIVVLDIGDYNNKNVTIAIIDKLLDPFGDSFGIPMTDVSQTRLMSLLVEERE